MKCKMHNLKLPAISIPLFAALTGCLTNGARVTVSGSQSLITSSGNPTPVLSQPTSPSYGVTIASPEPGASVTGSVHVVATAAERVVVSQIQVWDNDLKIGWYAGSSVDQSYPLGAGTHVLTIIDLDSNYNPINQTNVNYTVSAGSSGGGNPAPTPSPSPTPAPAPTAGVNVTSPMPYSVVGTSVRVAAFTVETVAVNQLQVWDNGVKLGYYPGSTVNTTYTLAQGTHALTVMDLDNSFQVIHKTTFNYVVSNTPPTSGMIPTPPSNAQVYSDLNATPLSKWKPPCTGACSGCPNGISCTPMPPAANFAFTQTASPSIDGLSDQFEVFNSPAFASIVWAQDIGAHDSAANFIFDYQVMVNSMSEQALEYDFWQAIGGTKFMFGSQCNVAAGVWDVWNEIAGTWVHTNVPCAPFAPNTWHHIVWAYQRLSNNTNQYLALQVDGITYAINMNEPSRSGSGWADSVGFQVQLDTNAGGAGYTEWLDQAKITMW